MEEYFQRMLRETLRRDGEFAEQLSRQLAFLGLDLDWLVGIAAGGIEMHAAPIPPLLHSLYDGPFQSCLVCDEELLSPPKEYLIVRMFYRDEPTMEYAICTGCNQRQWEQYSSETRARLEDHSDRDREVDERRTQLITESVVNGFEIEPWIAHCWWTGKPREQCETWQIAAQCVGPRLAPWAAGPWMRSGESLRASWKLWSRESRGSYDDFVECFLGPPPSLSLKDPVLLPAPVGGRDVIIPAQAAILATLSG